MAELLSEQVSKLKEMIEESSRICVFTGAGISCPSGIPDFRSANGIYNQKDNCTYEPEEMVSHSFFYSHTADFYDFYRSKMVYPKALPNAAHRYFADLEKSGKTVNVVTQNIDGLHQAAGSSSVFELHGSIHRNFCLSCGRKYDLSVVTDSESVIPRCPSCGGLIKPDVVLYEEGLDNDVINGAVHAIMTADLMIIIGTSLAVYPAAGFVQYFKGRNLVIINLSATPQDKNADLTIYADVEKVAEMLKEN